MRTIMLLQTNQNVLQLFSYCELKPYT